MTDKSKCKKPFSLLTTIIYVILITGVIYMAQRPSGSCPKGVAATTPIIKAKEIKLPSLLELGSKNCVPCHMMEPILAKLKKEYTGIIEVSFVDLELKENTAIGKKYRINNIPVQIFFDAEAKELWRHTGYLSEEDILKKWKALGYDLPALKKIKK